MHDVLHLGGSHDSDTMRVLTLWLPNPSFRAQRLSAKDGNLRLYSFIV